MNLEELRNVVAELEEAAKKFGLDPKNAHIEELSKECIRMRVGKLRIISNPGTFRYDTPEEGS